MALRVATDRVSRHMCSETQVQSEWKCPEPKLECWSVNLSPSRQPDTRQEPERVPGGHPRSHEVDVNACGPPVQCDVMSLMFSRCLSVGKCLPCVVTSSCSLSSPLALMGRGGADRGYRSRHPWMHQPSVMSQPLPRLEYQV